MSKSINEVKERLRKLYAMMDANGNASQQEIETALTKARKLMAEYKLSERDFIDEKEFEVIKKMLNIKFSTLVNPWIMDLNGVMAKNYCCHSVIYPHYKGKQKNVGLIGFESDVELCEKAMEYATNCILVEGKKIRKDAIKRGYTNSDATSMINAYGNGFVRGLREKFEEQNKQEEESFAMVMVEPQAVKDVVSGLSSSRFNTNTATRRARYYDEYAVNGFLDGKKFNMNDKLCG